MATYELDEQQNARNGRLLRRAIRLNNAYARTLGEPNGRRPSPANAPLIRKHWDEVTKELRAQPPIYTRVRKGA
jgi:hypothetical protein